MHCPERATLELAADGAAVPGLEEHLDRCQQCSSSFVALRDERELMRSVRRAHQATATESRADLPQGFELLRAIGRGGQGEVFECVQLSTGRRVALKLCVHRNMATASERARFSREIQIGARLSHPGLVTVYEAGATRSGTPYLVLELVRGLRWDEWSDGVGRASRQETERVLRAFVRLCEAIGHAHERGVVHRDLKPSNVLVDETDQPHVLDMGLAKVLQSEGVGAHAEITVTGELLGSLGWMSPERLAGVVTDNYRDDVYSLGLLLARACSGRHAFPLGNSLTDVVRGVATLPESLEGPFSTDPRLHRGVAGVLSRALAKAPSERFENARQFALEVQRLLDGGAPLPRVRRRRRELATLAAVAALTAVGWLLSRTPTADAANPAIGSEFHRLAERAHDDPLGARDEFWRLTCDSALDELGSFAPPVVDAPHATRWQVIAAQLRDALPLERVGLTLARHMALSSPGQPLGAYIDDDGTLVVCDDRTGEETGRWRIPVLPLHEFGGLHFLPDPFPTLTLLQMPIDPLSATAITGYSLERGVLRETWTARAPTPVLFANLAPPMLGCWSEEEKSCAFRDMRTGAVSHAVRLPERPVCVVANVDGTRLYFGIDGRSVIEVDIATGETRELDPRVAPPSNLIQVLSEDALLCGDLARPVLADPAGGAPQYLAPRQSISPATPLDPANGLALQRSHAELWTRARDPNKARWRVSAEWKSSERLMYVRPLEDDLVLVKRTSSVMTLQWRGEGFPRRHFLGGDTLHDLEVTSAGEWIAPIVGELAGELGGKKPFSRVLLSNVLVRSVDVGRSSGRVFWCADDGRVGALTPGGERTTLHEFSNGVYGESVATSPDEAALAIGDSIGNVTVLDLERGSSREHPFAAARRPLRVSDLLWLPDASAVVATTTDGCVSWCGADGVRHQEESQAGPARCIALEPRSRALVSGHDNGELLVWDASRSVVERHSLRDGVSIWSLDFSPDGELLAMASGRSVAVWDWPARRELFRSNAHEGRVFEVQFHPSQPVLASAGELGEFLVWDFGLAAKLLAREIDDRPGRSRAAFDSVCSERLAALSAR